MNYGKVVRYYKVSIIVLMNSCLLFVLVNMGAYVLNVVIIQIDSVFEEHGQSFVFEQIYPQKSPKEVNDLLAETWSTRLGFSQFTEKPVTGSYINVDENGFRIVRNQGDWPPDPNNYNIFLFGGSTTFGYGVADDETIASNLQEFLSNNILETEVRTYNFGRGYFYSTQERILFLQLLTSGFIPDMAIFLDGLNEFHFFEDEPAFTNQLKERFRLREYLTSKTFFLKILWTLPIMSRFAKRIPSIYAQYEYDESSVQSLINRYTENKKIVEAVSEVYGVKPIFVWQPVPGYKYNLSHQLFSENKHWSISILVQKDGFSQMAISHKDNTLGNNFLWCADMQEGVEKLLYVDQAHYTAEMSREIAHTICSFLQEHNLF